MGTYFHKKYKKIGLVSINRNVLPCPGMYVYCGFCSHPQVRAQLVQQQQQQAAAAAVQAAQAQAAQMGASGQVRAQWHSCQPVPGACQR